MMCLTMIANSAQAEDLSRCDIRLLALDEHQRPGDAGRFGPLGDGDDERDDRDRRAEEGHDEQQHEQQRQRHLRFEEPGDERVDPAAEVAGGGARDDADEAGDDDGQQADDKRGLAAVQDPRQQVTAVRVGAEQVARAEAAAATISLSAPPIGSGRGRTRASTTGRTTTPAQIAPTQILIVL